MYQRVLTDGLLRGACHPAALRADRVARNDGALQSGTASSDNALPDFAALHPGYVVSPHKISRLTKVGDFGTILPAVRGWTVFIQRVNF
ncbi:hypothetical protein H8A95_25000 [Bradyrhizobium sp. Pear76]|uniref:hypothetical protein n=1 Tax=Bradyrhizobium oropedii TaxID=1571201 RepID=UPI001E609E9B|nr:hypothetical protein [Bradyrhizobium oropedii]MCC8965488.1 hypothetical protein [Bradyrhizobium oropedii]